MNCVILVCDTDYRSDCLWTKLSCVTPAETGFKHFIEKIEEKEQTKNSFVNTMREGLKYIKNPLERQLFYICASDTSRDRTYL